MRKVILLGAALCAAFLVAQFGAATADTCSSACEKAYTACAQSCNKSNTDCFTKCINDKESCLARCQ
jgi:hypothetical protein